MGSVVIGGCKGRDSEYMVMDFAETAAELVSAAVEFSTSDTTVYLESCSVRFDDDFYLDAIVVLGGEDQFPSTIT